MSPGKKPLGKLDLALCDAAQMGNTAKIKDALAAGADVHVHEDYALCQAACAGNIAAMTILLAAGADANACKGRPLRYVAFDGNMEAMKILLDAKADVNATDDYGDTAVAVAAQRGHLEAVTMLLGAGAHVQGSGALARAAALGHTETVKLLIAAEAKERGSAALAAPSKIAPKAEAAAAACVSVRRPAARKPRAPGMG